MKDSLKRKILIIDDEISVSRFIRHTLGANGFESIEAASGQEGLQKFFEEKPELVILDFGLPDMTGMEVLRQLRATSRAPVIFLSVRDAEDEKVAALDAGADDYLTKPFGVAELIARIKVGLRHVQSPSDSHIFTTGALMVDCAGRNVKVSGHDMKLTATEFALLEALVNHAGKVVPHQVILKDVWGPNSVEHNHYLRVYFGQIRKKMDAITPGSSSLIENESGVGYRLKI